MVMSVLNKLASALGRRDEIPNQALAADIARRRDRKAVQELIAGLAGKDKRIQSDCIKVLYEIGERDAKLIAGYRTTFADLLRSKHNRLAWGAMTALDQIAKVDPARIYALIDQVCSAANGGSVITRDHAIGILTKLGASKRYAKACLPLLVEQLTTCPNNQLPMYAEMSLAVASSGRAPAVRNAIGKRLNGLEKSSQKKRVARVLEQMEPGQE
jgi:hypothetical protein